jgi:hypothetical protein
MERHARVKTAYIAPMRCLFVCGLFLAASGCVVLPDIDHVLVIRMKENGGDYFAKRPGPYSPAEIVQLPINDVIRKRLSRDDVLDFMRAKVPHSLGAKFTAGGEMLVKVGDEYFVSMQIGDLENPHASDCPKSFYVLISADGIPVAIEEDKMQTCPA